MIYDQLANAHRYRGLHPLIGQGLDWLAARQEEPFTVSRDAIVGDTLSAFSSEYLSKPRADGVWETHRFHADIQLIQEGEELMDHAPASALTGPDEYDAEKDRTLYRGPVDAIQTLHFRPGWFAIFFPEDGHRPDLAVAAPAPVRKRVVKIRL